MNPSIREARHHVAAIALAFALALTLTLPPTFAASPAHAESLTDIVREQLDRDDAPEVAFIPAPPPGVYRGPDLRWDLPDVRRIAHLWLSDDGQSARALIDRGDPPPSDWVPGDTTRYPPAEAVYVELDLATRQITRALPLPGDPERWVASGSTVHWHASSNRLIARYDRHEPLPDDAKPGVVYMRKPLGWSVESLAIDALSQGHPVEPSRRDFGPLPPGQRAYGSMQDAWKLRFVEGDDGLWWLIEQSEDNRVVGLRLQRWNSATLETDQDIELDWRPPAEWSTRSRSRYDQVTWQIDVADHELNLAYADPTADDGGRFPIRLLSFSLETGKRTRASSIASLKHYRNGVWFDGEQLVTLVTFGGDEHQYGPFVLWDLPQRRPIATLAARNGWGLGFGRISADGRYVFHRPITTDDNGAWPIWRYDVEEQRWAWPRDLAFTQGGTDHQLSADGQTMLSYSRAEGRADRINVFRFGDHERYDQELAERWAEQLVIDADPPPLPPIDRQLVIGEQTREIEVEREPVPIPEGRVLHATVSSDGQRLALWLTHMDRWPDDPASRQFPDGVPSETGIFTGHVIDTSNGRTLFDFTHPDGMRVRDLPLVRPVFGGERDAYLVVEFPRNAEQRIPSPGLSPPRTAVVEVFDSTGRVVSRLDWPTKPQNVDDEVEHPIAGMLHSGLWRVRSDQVMLWQNSYQESVYAFYDLPGLERLASFAWPNRQDDAGRTYDSDQMVHHAALDRDAGEFVVHMRELNPYQKAGRAMGQGTQWLQRFDVATLRPAGRGFTVPGEYAPSFRWSGGDRVAVTYQLTSPTEKEQRAGNEPRYALRVHAANTGEAWVEVVHRDGRGVYGQFIDGTDWLVIQPGSQINGKPGVVLVHVERGEVVGPWPISDARSIRWIDDAGERALVFNDRRRRFGGSPRDTPQVEWVVRQPD